MQTPAVIDALGALAHVPCEVEFVASLPKSATGKIDWRLLQEQEAARR